jgi:hypothetical protein
MNSGHQTLSDTEVIMDDLGKRGQAVSRARSIRHDPQIGLVGVVVHTNDEHGSLVLGWGRHDNLLGAASEVLGGSLFSKELAGGLHDVLSTAVTPLDGRGVKVVRDGDGLSIDDQLSISNFNSSGILAVD